MSITKIIKIKNSDGTFTEVNIGALASNVILNSNSSVENVIGNINIEEQGSIAEQLIQTEAYSESIRVLEDQNDAQSLTIENLETQVNTLNTELNSSKTLIQNLEQTVNNNASGSDSKNTEQDDKILELNNELTRQVTLLQQQIDNINESSGTNIWGNHTVKIFTDTDTNEIRTGIYYGGGSE